MGQTETGGDGRYCACVRCVESGWVHDKSGDEVGNDVALLWHKPTSRLRGEGVEVKAHKIAYTHTGGGRGRGAPRSAARTLPVR